jgi:hypothetical protein
LKNRRTPWLAATLLAGIFFAPVGCSFAGLSADHQQWRMARRDSAGLSPAPQTTSEAVVQVFSARTVGWRGAVGEHGWIVAKRAGAAAYTRYEVIGWGVQNGANAVRINARGPDDHWFGARPTLIAERRGPDVDALIDRIEMAVRTYPYPHTYRTWPGPNSNTFIAHVARQVPELDVDLPPTAIGKDFLPNGGIIAAVPSGSGYQVSLFGLAGVMLALNEGIEVNLLGLTAGIDLREPALKLPGIGRLDLAR